MALTDDVKEGLSFLKDLQAKAADNKEALQKAGAQLEGLAAMLKGLASGDSTKLNIQLTQWEGVNRLLAAQASAEAELTKSAPPDWNKIGDGIANVAGIAVKIGLAVAAAV